MNRVTTISLNGNSYQLEEQGYEALRAYLEGAAQRLADNPDKAEILADLEQAIADKCNRFLTPHKNVVGASEIEQVLREMGPVDGSVDAEAPQAGASAAGGTSDSSTHAGASADKASAAAPKRLYQIREGAMISGVCNGIAAYLGIDVTLVRVIFVALAILTWGGWILAYIVMMFVIPYAQTSEQHAAAHGWAFNAQELIDRAKQHYAQFKDGQFWRHQRREQRRAFRSQRRQWRAQRWGARHCLHEPPHWGGRAEDVSYAAHVLGGVLIPIAGVIRALLFVALLLAIGSLLTKHAILGWMPPAGIPLWVAIVILFVLYHVVTGPLRFVDHFGHYHGYPGTVWLAMWSAVFWLACVVVLSWLAFRHWPELQQFLQQIPGSLHTLGAQVRGLTSGL
ncbi:MAG TPA: PspC domain-containing protein [Steroidobacteraceae bacterium]|nr:PspC domain-containing protein [Steroidobacteraceae bacterium]